MSTTFINYEQMLRDTLEWAKTLSSDFDIVIGIPRSGIIIAGILATKFGKPLSTPDVFIDDMKYWFSSIGSGGHDTWKSELIGHKINIQKILLVDDTITRPQYEDSTMYRNVQKILSKYPNLQITTATLYVTEVTKDMVNLHYKLIGPCPHILEWNIMHGKAGLMATDMDGVLCEDCPVGVDQDEPKYLDWLLHAKPKMIPAYEINFIITSRLEKYRLQTEQWLREHNVRYSKLYMWNLPEKSLRTNHAQWKAETLREVNNRFNDGGSILRYFESEHKQATEIFERCKGIGRIQVLDIETMTLLQVIR